MKYANDDGDIAEVLSEKADNNNQVLVKINGQEARLMDYDDFIQEFKRKPKE